MLFYMGLFFLVVAVSIDGFGVGITYGLRKIKVPVNALVIIMICSGAIVFLSMKIGSILQTFISPVTAKLLGGLILICLGFFVLFQMIRSKVNTVKMTVQSTKRFRDIKTVLATPDQADLDQSGIISAKEAVLLGTALALDAFGAGLGAALLGYSPLVTTILIAFTSGLFVFSGIKIGLLLSKNKHMEKLSLLPPLLLIALGMFNILQNNAF
ncbi:sporulation membrane protein YtaF [Virgibacillus sp. W0430]|uniref:sporulation membrane protein YtaF n=1 Tax=Virgibacillus sp. W0430 TaxID=3391580 RepID=UPI003F487A48